PGSNSPLILQVRPCSFGITARLSCKVQAASAPLKGASAIPSPFLLPPCLVFKDHYPRSTRKCNCIIAFLVKSTGNFYFFYGPAGYPFIGQPGGPYLASAGLNIPQGQMAVNNQIKFSLKIY
ncbi:hypothetical protein, partial [Desulfofundulus luciae]|uniref:hypothetical protein n=1 Tax=Desulfofundulus luciae TaxID=74702 RepID=UPI0027D89434